MAKQEVPKEDLIAQATALVNRIEFRTDSDQPLIVVGFRSDDSISFYFGEQPVYQFNTRDELRRVHVEAGMLKAEHRRLVRLEKRRTQGEVQLIRHELSDEDQAALISDVQRRLEEIADSITTAKSEVTRQVPEGAPILERVHDWIIRQNELTIADSPNVVA